MRSTADTKTRTQHTKDNMRTRKHPDKLFLLAATNLIVGLFARNTLVTSFDSGGKKKGEEGASARPRRRTASAPRPGGTSHGPAGPAGIGKG